MRTFLFSLGKSLYLLSYPMTEVIIQMRVCMYLHVYVFFCELSRTVDVLDGRGE